MALFKEKDSGTTHKRQKPVKLYEQLLKEHHTDKSLHVIDACGGAGTCAIACISLGMKCVVLEKSKIKARLIRQQIE